MVHKQMKDDQRVPWPRRCSFFFGVFCCFFGDLLPPVLFDCHAEHFESTETGCVVFGVCRPPSRAQRGNLEPITVADRADVSTGRRGDGETAGSAP